MIKVLKGKNVPRAEVTCNNCGSLLEYGNADLSKDYNRNDSTTAAYKEWPWYYFTCPVCGCKVSASWINKKEE